MKKKIINFLWKKKNKHNYTTLVNGAGLDKIKVGEKSYGPIEAFFFGSDNESLTIGNYVSIAHNVTFLCGGNHYYKGFTTYPIKSKLLKMGREAETNGAIIVEDDVWIGYDSLILSGVTLGKGSVIAAGSTVTKDTLPFWIYGGNPAKPIKPRFDEKYILPLLEVDYCSVMSSIDANNVEKLYKEMNDEYIEFLLDIKGEK